MANLASLECHAKKRELRALGRHGGLGTEESHATTGSWPQPQDPRAQRSKRRLLEKTELMAVRVHRSQGSAFTHRSKDSRWQIHPKTWAHDRGLAKAGGRAGWGSKPLAGSLVPVLSLMIQRLLWAGKGRWPHGF